jgi:hypothetical protein
MAMAKPDMGTRVRRMRAHAEKVAKSWPKSILSLTGVH